MSEKVYKIYKEWLNEDNHCHFKEQLEKKVPFSKLFGSQQFLYEEYIKLFKFYNKKFEGNVLDVGCSHGGFTYNLYNSNSFEYICGIDIDSKAIELANSYRDYLNIDSSKLLFADYDLYNLPFDNETFDVIIMKEIGEHLESEKNLINAIIELKRVLKEDGTMFIETPNYLFPMEVHLKMPLFPWISNKKIAKIIAYFLRKDVKYIEYLNFTTPNMFETIFKNNNLKFSNAYEDYKLPYIVNNSQNLSDRCKFIGGLFEILNKIGLNDFLIWLFKFTKMYPSLWYMVSKNK